MRRLWEVKIKTLHESRDMVPLIFRKLAGKVIYITGGSRGIGLAMALKAAKDGAKIVIAAKTADPHPKVREGSLGRSRN